MNCTALKFNYFMVKGNKTYCVPSTMLLIETATDLTTQIKINVFRQINEDR